MSINRNKKSEKAFHAKARNTWERNPLTQVVSNAKAYNRKKYKGRLHQTYKQGNDGASFIFGCLLEPINIVSHIS